MKRFLPPCLLLFLLTACQTEKPLALATVPAGARQAVAWRMVAYYPSWVASTRGFPPSSIPAASLTHINYAFARPDAHGKCVMDDATAAAINFPALQALRRANPQLKLLLSIGGGSNLDQPFANVVASPESTTAFSASCLELVKKWELDGLDLDWEFPFASQKQQYTNLLSELRRHLDALGNAKGRAYLLTNAVPAGLWALTRMDVPAIAPLLDWVNLMGYDFYGSWSKVTGHHAPLYNNPVDPQRLSVDISVKAYLLAGLPPEKMVVGVPFYGRGWSGVEQTQGGLFQDYDSQFAGGTYDYRDILVKYQDGFVRSWDAAAQAPWLYNTSKQVMITYEDAQSLRAKRDYARRLGLGGMMIWQIAGDDKNGTLLKAVGGN